ncbi:hypothetical protein D7D52_16910 [Nocardia yunnanensis]|uniref:Uncharacterized protein n=1 Tax=Nocardia yunnanensis TaxID=2382165 RepID=A0A386ZC84_9NOCA|nr:hypothetical protein [Nocardia yunnanensis]AYF75271.1 hypothetical protein D7D52_16910 [Nocardia yunnanensis]
MTSNDHRSAEFPPIITAADIVGGRDQVNHVTLSAEHHHIALRFVLRVDSYLGQSRFTVEGFGRLDLQWRVLWSITPETYAYESGPDTPAVTDPESTLIASPSSRTDEIKAQSWQKIINTLAAHADRILS